MPMKLDQFGEFQRNRTVIPHFLNLTHFRTFLHRAVFDHREMEMPHFVALQFDLDHIHIKVQVVCHNRTASIGCALEIEQCHLDGDTLGARQFASNAVNRRGFRRNRNVCSERNDIVDFVFCFLGFVVINSPTQLDDVWPLVDVIHRNILRRETRCLGVNDKNTH